MSEMLTRVGGAILLAESQWTGKSGVSKERAMALAAIEAMRDPTKDMKDAACAIGPDTNCGQFDYDNATDVYGAMIDAALK